MADGGTPSTGEGIRTSLGSNVEASTLWRIAERILAPADVRLNGTRPWDIKINSPAALARALYGGSVGFGEAYVEGLWETEDLEELACRLGGAGTDDIARFLPGGLKLKLAALLTNRQSPRRADHVARAHYDFGNDLFLAFLGQHPNYSCGYFRDTTELDRAQVQKMELICRKLNLRPGEHLLDVGGGWGELARHAATNYGVRVTSINLSEQQMQAGRERCRGLPVEIVKSDYRAMYGRYDKIAAIAMFTHVGPKNYRTFMEAMHRLLRPQGTLLMEGVWGNTSVTHIDGWMDKYIFPNATIPSGAQTFEAFEGLFVAEDLHNFGPSYVHTLRAWNRNLELAWPELGQRYDERVKKTFEYFFLTIAGFFRARALSNWHLVLTRLGAEQPPCRIT